MESAFYCLLRNTNSETSAQVELNIGNDKPLFEEDVQPEWQHIYRLFEFLATPLLIYRVDTLTLQIGWDIEFDSAVVQELMDACRDAGCTVLSPLLWLESGAVLNIVHIDECGWQLSPVLSSGEEVEFDDESLLQWMLDRTV